MLEPMWETTAGRFQAHYPSGPNTGPEQSGIAQVCPGSTRTLNVGKTVGHTAPEQPAFKKNQN